jgi:hypothetical protein
MCEGHKKLFFPFRYNQKIIILNPHQISHGSDFFSVFGKNRTPDDLERIIIIFV